MKKILRFLFERPMDMLFLMRMSSIERHIHYAVDQVSFDHLNIVRTRLRLELQFRHTEQEFEMINEMLELVNKASFAIENQLILESL